MHRYIAVDGVADRDLAVGEDVRVQAGAVDVCLDHAGARHALERRARLAELDADALDVADAEALADERVQVDPAREHVAAAFGGVEIGIPVSAAPSSSASAAISVSARPGGAVVEEVAVALEPAACDARGRARPARAAPASSAPM